MKFYNHIIETIGNTPMVKLNKVVDTEALVLAKVESFNPGHSTKDRMALNKPNSIGVSIRPIRIWKQ